MTDIVNHPPHYNHGKYECAEVILDWKLNYLVGNAVKYLCRYEYKGKPIEDIKKAMWYLERELKRLESETVVDIPNEATKNLGDIKPWTKDG